MLLIGDIHITTKYTNQILDSIQTFVDKFPAEKNLIFLGDYMYMFSYDRKALACLFDLFLGLRKQGKNVYILAGNHDWIGQQFVYAEGKKIADMLPQNTGNTIRFITSPELHTVEGKEMLFFPFTKHISVPENISRDDTTDTIKKLLASKNNNERLSGEINLLLHDYITKNPNLTIIHHYYIADTKFPGQQAIFDYKDIALCPDILDKESLNLISGHIHMPFACKNYLCTGSVRYTSPLEQDHHKFHYVRNTNTNEVEAHQIAINPYIVMNLQSEQKLSVSAIQDHRKSIDKKISESFGGKWKINHNFIDYSLANTHITLLSENISYDQLEQHIDENVLKSAKELSLKKKTTYNTDMSLTLDMAQRNLQESLIDRKIIVKNFIMSRFGNDFDKYRTLLDELHILS